MFNCDTISLVFIAINLAVSQGLKPWRMCLRIVPNANTLANNETSLSIRQSLTLFSRFVKAQEQFFHFNPDKHQGAETEANHQFKPR
ncbi:hypothetical protein E5S67_05840 [Microcoleus sp. IPMA8]|uniref:Secreted protein n=1 Tax=Microcoleus asticus IPMA8 TaxID=2563858 RepID=A0ABX2D7C6_9CYAN|nr:hypothetical protein [Microcoleus asticus IPMA8]